MTRGQSKITIYGPKRDGMHRITSRTIRNGTLVVICFFAGHFLADWVRGPRVRPIEVVCSHVDYLFEHADEITTSKQWRNEFSQLKNECDAGAQAEPQQQEGSQESQGQKESPAAAGLGR
jgi:hypothetical protein